MTSSDVPGYSRAEVDEVAMMKIEVVIHPFKLDEVKAELEALDCQNITVSEVFLKGDTRSFYRGCEYRIDVPRVKVEMLLSAHRVDEVVKVLSQVTSTEKVSDDRTILVYELSEAIRMRGGKRIEFSLA
jgi:nitrogen regulatory protein PII